MYPMTEKLGSLYCSNAVFMSCFAFSPEGEEPVRTISTLSHGGVDNKRGLNRVGFGIRGYGVGPEHVAV